MAPPVTDPQVRSNSSGEEQEAPFVLLTEEGETSSRHIGYQADFTTPFDCSDHTAWVADAGIDTISYAWHPASKVLWAAMRVAAQRGWLAIRPHGPLVEDGSRRVRVWRDRGEGAKTRGPLYRIEGTFAGVRWFFHTRHELIYCEGRLAALLADDPKASGLASRHCLVAGVRRASSALASLDIDLHPNEARVRRLDSAVDFGFQHSVCGEVLMEEARRHLPGKAKTEWIAERIETVYTFDSKHRINWRVYDKGLEANTCAAAQLIRIERQYNWDRERQRPAEVIGARQQQVWLNALKTWLLELPSLGRWEEAMDSILDRSRSGEIDLQSARTLQGLIVTLERRGRADWPPEEKRQRNRAIDKLRKTGIEVTWPEARGEPASGTAWCRLPGRSVAPSRLLDLLVERLDLVDALLGCGR